MPHPREVLKAGESAGVHSSASQDWGTVTENYVFGGSRTKLERWKSHLNYFLFVLKHSANTLALIQKG